MTEDHHLPPPKPPRMTVGRPEDRLAKALERIAEALEAIAERLANLHG